MSAVGRWIERRRSLKEEYQRILLVDSEANELVEELRRRRDRLTPRRLSFPYLREALHEVEEHADSREDICPECQAIELWLNETSAHDLAAMFPWPDLGGSEILEAIERAYPADSQEDKT